MMGRQSRQMAMVFVDMASLIPENHLLRKIDGMVSFDFIYGLLAPYYSATGRPSVDPVSMFKMLLVGYLYGIKSERRLVEEIRLNIAYRWFCGFELDDAIPDHSTFSKTRTRKWQQSGLFQNAFYEIVKQCIACGLIDGKAMAADGSYIPANVSRESWVDALSPFTDKSTRQAAIRYLRALQFSSLIMEPISYYAADLFQPADFIQLERRFAVPQSILLNDIIETMMQRIGLPPLLVIMTEARRMTDWGYFLAFYKNKRQTIAALNEKSLLAYQYLCKDDKKAFAHAVASCYHDILDSVRKQLATYFHLAEADSILTPPFLFT